MVVRFNNSLLINQDTIRAISSTHDQKRFISASDDKCIKIWDFETRSLITAIEGAHDSIFNDLILNNRNCGLYISQSRRSVSLFGWMGQGHQCLGY